ncbi:hypothetical protein H0W26_04035 [Candidatus Dependentiae bacterium]|nr:hypothetical protein [Candidatus Dependentiae bacterium]
MNHSIYKPCFLLLVNLFVGFSTHCMESICEEERHSKISLFSDDADSFESDLHPELTSMKTMHVPGLLYELKENISCVAYSPDDRTIITGSHSGSICLWDSKSGKLLQKRVHRDESICSVTCDSSGTTFFTGSDNGIIRQWDLKTGKRLLKLSLKNRWAITSLACSSNNDLILVGFDNGEAKLVNIKTQEMVYELTGHHDITLTAFNVDNSIALIESSNGHSSIIHLYDTEKKTLVDKLEGNNHYPIKSTSYSADKTIVAIVFQDRTACVYDIKTGYVLLSLEKNNATDSAEVSHDGTALITSSWEDRQCHSYLWDIEKGIKLQSLSLHNENVSHSGIRLSSPDKLTFLTEPSKDTIFLINLDPESTPLLELKKDIFSIRDAAFSPDGKILGILTGSKEIYLWDTKSGDQMAYLKDTLPGKIGFSPCGKIIFVKNGRQATYLWVRSDNIEQTDTIQQTPNEQESQSKEKSSTLSFTQAINLDDDSQKECSIQ